MLHTVVKQPGPLCSQAVMDRSLPLSLVTSQGSYAASSSRAAAMFMQVAPLKSPGLLGCASCEKGLVNEALNMQ